MNFVENIKCKSCECTIFFVHEVWFVMPLIISYRLSCLCDYPNHFLEIKRLPITINK